MMPKGVEHLLPGYKLQATGLVKIPMMPKGVEHPVGELAPGVQVRLCEDSNDAERR